MTREEAKTYCSGEWEVSGPKLPHHTSPSSIKHSIKGNTVCDTTDPELADEHYEMYFRRNEYLLCRACAAAWELVW